MNARAREHLIVHVTPVLEYLAIADSEEPADIIWGLGSADIRVAERAADLYHRGLAPWIVFSGGVGHRWALAETEADLFAATAVERGVPIDRIVRENRSTNTAENVTLSLAMLTARGLSPASALLITIPPFQRRASLTVRTHRPDLRCLNAPIDWGRPADWNDEQLTQAAELCAGEIRRLRDYPGRGFIRFDPDDLPHHVLVAADALERG